MPVNCRLAAGIGRARAVAFRLTAAMAASVIVSAVALAPVALAGSAGTAATTAIAAGPGNTGCCGEN